MAGMNLNTDSLQSIRSANLSDKQERQKILDYLYQLTEQLRYWQYNLELENMTDAFQEEYAGLKSATRDNKGNISKIQQTSEAITARVENAEGDVANLQVMADQISQRVENAEGDATIAMLTAERALIKAENAEGEVAYLSVEVDEIRSMVGTQDGQTTFVQYEEPDSAEVGDLWMRTGAARWMTFLANTWGEIGTQAWGAYFNPIPATYIWDGTKWQLVADQAVITEQYTLITQNREQISQMATKTELTAAEKRISTAEEKITPEAITNTVTSSTQYKNDLGGKASTGDVSALANRVSTAENKITPEAITNTVRTSTEYQNDLNGKANTSDLAKKVDQTVFEQTNNAFDLRVQTVEEQAGKAETVTNTAMTLDNTGIHMKTGGTFTVDSGNFDVDENGNVSMNNASVNGNLTNNGIAVLTAKNLVVSSTQPTSPVPGMVWVKPVGSVAATFLYNNTSVQSFEAFETAHTLTNAGSAVAASGSYTFNVKIPYKVLSTVKATRYLTMMVGSTAIFTDAALELTAGSYVLELSGTLSSWLGNASSLSFTLDLHYLGGDDGTLHNVHRVDVGAIDLKLYAKSDAASGWSGTEVQVYNG